MCLLLRKCVCCWENLSIAEKMCLLLRKCVCCWENVSFPEKMWFFPEKMCLLLRKCVFSWENVFFSWENVSIAKKMCFFLRKCGFFPEKMCLLLRKCVFCWKMCLLLRKCVYCWENVSIAEKMCLLLRKCVFCWENVSFAEKSSINLLNCVDLKALQGLGIWFYLTYTHVFVALDVLHFKTIQHLFWALVKHKWLAKFTSIFAWKLATFELMCASKNNFFSVTKWRRYVEKQENEITPSLQEYW